jgi:O-antigen/teichoic acid export membrane protein
MWRDIFKANLIYAIGSLANSAALFVLIPYLVTGLSAQEYGLWSLIEVVVLLLNMLIVAGLEIGVLREYSNETDPAQRARLLGTVLMVVAGWGLAVVVISGLTIAPIIAGDIAPATRWLVLAVAWTEGIWTVGLNILRTQERARSFITLSLARLVIFIAVAVGLVSNGYGINGALIGRLAATLISTAAILSVSWRMLSPHFDLAVLRRTLRYGLPLLPSNLAVYLMVASDRYVLQHVATLETVAVYSFAYKIASLLELGVTRPFSIDWATRRFKIAKTANAPIQYARIFTMYLAVATGCALMIMSVAPAIYRLVAPPAYQAGIQVIPILLLAYIFSGIAHPLNVGIMIKDRTRALPLVSWGAALLCLGLNYWWIPQYGMVGAAWATAVAYAAWSGGIAWMSLRIYHIPYSLRDQGVIVLLAVLGYAGLWLIDQSVLPTLAATGLKCGWIGVLSAGGGYRLWMLT